MDPVRNPFTPGAGTPPPLLAGRDALRETVRVALERVRLGLPTKSIVMIGLRGVGKTVLLDRMREAAEGAGIQTLPLDAREGRSLPALLAPQLRQALLRLARNERAKAQASRALRALSGFAKGLKVEYDDIEVGFDFAPEPGFADNGDLEHDLQVLLEAAAAAAKVAGTALVLFIDELQYVEADQLAALIAALHRAAQQRLPVALVGVGLPKLRGQMGSLAERLFNFPEIGSLLAADAHDVLAGPIRDQGADITDDALQGIVRRSRGYPYFLQEWGKHTWDAATASPITLENVRRASASTVAALDDGFFRVGFDRLTQIERNYLRAMAELGAGPHRSGDIAGQLGRKVTSLGPIRNQLIAKGMIWSPGHGDTSFTVPLFDEFMRRIMPDDDWR